MPQLRLQDVPAQGRASTIYLNLLALGDRNAPIFQTLSNTGFTALVTVVNAVDAASYIAVVGGITHTVVAVTGDTDRSVAQKLMNLIDAGASGAKAYNLRAIGNDFAFNLLRATTFTLVNTGTTTPADLTVSSITGTAAALARGATSMTLPFALIGRIAAGQFLRFANGNTEVTVEVATTAEVGATSLSLVAIDEAIPAVAIAAFPPEFTHRMSAGMPITYEMTKFATLNTGGFEDGVQTKASSEIDLAGIYFEIDPVYRTIVKGAKDGREFFAILDYPAPKEGWSGRRLSGVCGITSREEPINVDGFIEANWKAMMKIHPIDTAAAPL